MDSSRVRVVYDGPAVEDGEMDVSQLAPSLLALGKLIENADAVLTGETSRVRVRVSSDVRRGSFDVGIVVAFDSAWDLAKSWVMSSEGMTTTSILSLLGLNGTAATKTLIQALKWAKGRKITTKTTLGDGNTELAVLDGDTLTVPTAVARLFDEPSVRLPLERFTDPLREDGIDAIRFEDELGLVRDQITAFEANAFIAAGGAEPTSSSRFTATYQIKRLHFEPGKKWRLSSGAQAIFADIEDADFLERIQKSEERFSANDYLVCEVRMDQWLGPTGLKTEYAIERVVEHIPAPSQPPML